MSRRAPLLAAIGMALLVIIVVFLAVLPKMREVTTVKGELADEKQTQQFLLLELDRLREARSQLPEVRRRLAKFNQKVPATADLPGLIRLVQNAADASNLEFFSIGPGAPTPIGGAPAAVPPPPGASPTPTPSPTGTVPPPIVSTQAGSVIPATVVIIGGFFDVDQFLFRLETLPRAAKVTSVTVAAGPDASNIPGQLSVTLIVDFFTSDPNAGPGSAPETPLAPAPAVTTTPTTPAPTLTTTAPTTSPTAGG